jgi:hypothetical protein
MFTHLLRRLADSIDRVRVGFLSEPVALAAPNPKDRPVRVFDLASWLKQDDRNGDDDAIASIDRYDDGKEYAVIVTARSRDVIVIDIDGRRADFLKEFLDEKAIRSVFQSGIREARINPPPPPPPPGRPLWELVGRLDGLLRVGQLPVVHVESLTRGGLVG